MNITYNNCKVGSNEDIDKTVECPYIPYRNIKGIMTLIFSALGLVIELIFLIIVIIFRREKCIYIGGFSFLIFLVISSIFLDSSIIFLIGKLTKFKCILKFWLTILGITGFIFSYSVKSEVIIAIYNARNVIKSNNKRNTYTLYSIIIGMQVIMLIMWTFTHEGVILKNRNLKFLINFQYESCSLGNESILTLIFSIDYILLLLSVLTTYRGRNIPAEFNESKKVFVCTLVFFLILILCHTATVINFDDGLAHIIISTFIIVIIFIINLTFIGSKLSIIFELEPKNSIIVIDPDDSINSTNKHAKSEAFSNTFSRESL
ncbi:hypothetical protein BCR32DRAFT_100871 [Anaeromyces robustus]|uniref:G-protein coupled receptors family 3 profile domain-containing protein n=1 Tax=Anaeromyces robustus TaxID=1754192 RepID=A0A1Y1WH69_9FUNG|nr:hypothetical protein BCR32DRAFT_100871 [Anaeromyces robustus]|eukprot:ORX72576.1 hypothetical protein BCR32DRAFT_100871 [Anaeromyces robustus]